MMGSLPWLVGTAKFGRKWWPRPFLLVFIFHGIIRNVLETLKIRGLTFRLMPTTVLALTLSFGSESDQWLTVCKDWLEALQSVREGHVAGDDVASRPDTDSQSMSD